MKYEPVIGLEVHVELNTKTKMFCRCSADYFGKKPNTHTCPVCLGLPGALPFINKEAIEDCMKIGLALNCTVSPRSLFERKNYFYPDLPKGYQISQYRWPLCVEGELWVTNAEGSKKRIRINRVHQEEDTGKLSHPGGVTLIDYNRSGGPLVEIVTEPDFRDVVEVREYAKKLQQIFRYLGVSNADMERGDMRLEANVSVRPVVVGFQATPGSVELPNYRIELKNINSFRFMTAAIEYEIKRQIEELEKGQTLKQETRGWDEDKKETYLQRSKEEAHDYRYFPDPDLPELKIKSQESRVKEDIPELPDPKVARFIQQYGLSKEQTRVLTEDKKTADYFEEAVKAGQQKQIEARQIANFIVNQKVDVKQVAVGKIIDQIIQKDTGKISDVGELKRLAEEVIKENPKSVGDYRDGKIAAIQSLIGGVMRKTGGKADVAKLKEIFQQLLST